jgi:hypothetical protein
MGPVRVLGRIDLAQQVYDLLRGAGVEARLSTSAPMAAAAETGKDGTTLDVYIGEGIDLHIDKRRHPARPLVVLAHPALLPGFEARARTATGPDAWAAWPATAAEIVAACQRAVERATTPRPRRTTGQLVASAGLVLLTLAVVLASIFGPRGPNGEWSDPMGRMLRGLLGVYFLGSALRFWRRRAAAVYYKLGFGFFLFMGGAHLVLALL